MRNTWNGDRSCDALARTAFWCALGACLAVGVSAANRPARAEPPQAGFGGVSWIWYSAEPGRDMRSFPSGLAFFRAAVAVPENPPFRAAEIFITADNLYTLYLNGQLVGQSDSNPNLWKRPKRFDVSGQIVAGQNVVAVEAVNTIPGPAGLLVKFVARATDGSEVVLATSDAWKASAKAENNWQQADFEDDAWRPAAVVATYGDRPWGDFARDLSKLPVEEPWPARREPEDWHRLLKKEAARQPASAPVSVVEVPPAADYPWPLAVAFLGDDCSLYRQAKGTGTSHDSLNVTVFTARKSRAYPEHDLPAPIKVGRKLYLLQPARPGVTPRLLLDAGRGAIGSPSVSFDGQWLYVSMAYDGEPFFHIYRLSVAGGSPQRLTDGPFHDIDPVELPNGRIAFTSTRIGTFEEYHSPPSRALFAMDVDGQDVRPLTHTFIFDNEPEVLADGRILFIRSDNFFDRGKVETLLHAVHPDGTEGYTEFGLDLGPEYGGRLRAFHCGSPAPMPDGRVAFVSSPGLTIARPGSAAKDQQHLRLDAGDVAALPDGRLLATLARLVPYETKVKNETRTAYDYQYEKLVLLDPSGSPIPQTLLYESPGAAIPPPARRGSPDPARGTGEEQKPPPNLPRGTGEEQKGAGIHSPIYVGPRPRPPVLAEKVQPTSQHDVAPTGFFFCQNARFTKNSTAGWSHVRAIRVLAGQGLTVRSSHAYIVHAGSEVTELGTIPLAPDGSFYVEVPADRAIAFQAVDAEGRSELNEMSWIYVRPGEQRSCLGCHHPRQAAPARQARLAQALQTKPLRLLGQGQPHRFRGNNAAVTGLMELQFDRYREVAGLNRHAGGDDPLASRGREVAVLIEQLNGDESGLRISAAQRLSIFRDPAAAPALAARLSDDLREVRVAAAIALAACGRRDSVPPLLAALDDASPWVAQAAAVALENLTGHVEPFGPFADPRQRRQQAALWRAWFDGTSWDAIERELLQRLDTDDRDAIRRAAVTLGHVGSQAARTALRDYVTRARQENPVPEWRKDHRGDGTRFNSLAAVNPRTLQAATRALGYLQDTDAVPLLAQTLAHSSDPDQGNLFLAEAAAEALGRIGTREAETALVESFAGLQDYIRYTNWYGDHTALMACHASPVHYFILESLDAMESPAAGRIVPRIIHSVPTDPDRALFPGNDDCEVLSGRVIRRSGREREVIETCLAVLGDAQAARSKEIEDSLKTLSAWAGTPGPEIRAAQILSLACRDRQYEPRIRAALDRYRDRPVEGLVRAFTGSGLPRGLPVKHWVCFFLARELGNLTDPASVDALLAVLEQCPPEAADGHPDPTDPSVLFLHNDFTPCYRAAAAWALGRIGNRRAVGTLLNVVGDLRNATDTRHAAAEALARIRDPASLESIARLAADYPEVSTRRVLLRIKGKE